MNPILSEANSIIKKSIHENQAAVMTTLSRDNKPHSCYMSANHFNEYNQIYTITAPSSRKVENILQNGLVQWLFLSIENNISATLNCHASIIMTPAKIKHYLSITENLDQAHFLPHQSEYGMKFILIESNIHSIEISDPCHNRMEQLVIGSSKSRLENKDSHLCIL